MLSIFIPAYNEESIIVGSAQKVHNYLLERDLEHEIIVVSNGSTDSTEQICLGFAEKESWFRFFSLPHKGVGTAFVLAVKEAKFEKFITLDADLSSDLAFIEYAYRLLDYAEMVVGSKTMGSQRRTALRILGSNLYLLISQLLFDLSGSDYSLGSKAFKRKSILPALAHIDSWTGYIFELAMFLKVQGKRVVQIGIDCNDKRKSRFSLLHEGFYRYNHLFHVWRLLKNRQSWIYSATLD